MVLDSLELALQEFFGKGALSLRVLLNVIRYYLASLELARATDLLHNDHSRDDRIHGPEHIQ